MTSEQRQLADALATELLAQLRGPAADPAIRARRRVEIHGR